VRRGGFVRSEPNTFCRKSQPTCGGFAGLLPLGEAMRTSATTPNMAAEPKKTGLWRVSRLCKQVASEHVCWLLAGKPQGQTPCLTSGTLFVHREGI
jgi:hypothetical protein